ASRIQSVDDAGAVPVHRVPSWERGPVANPAIPAGDHSYLHSSLSVEGDHSHSGKKLLAPAHDAMGVEAVRSFQGGFAAVFACRRGVHDRRAEEHNFQNYRT